jgi:uncharacterized protein (DUF2141 family)
MSCFFNFSNFSVIGDCQNNGSGEITLNLSTNSEPMSITWFSPNPWPPGGGPTVETGILSGTRTYSNLPAGLYVLEVNDSCGGPTATTQNNRATLNIYVSSASSCVSITNLTPTTCGVSNGALTATTTNFYGQGRFELFKDGVSFQTATTIVDSAVFQNLSSGVYYIVADDGGGCTGNSENCIVTDSTALNYGLYVVNGSNCGSINGGFGKLFITGLTGVAPYTYLWSSPTPALLPTNQPLTGTSLTGLSVGYYSVTITDAQNCTLTQTAQIIEVPPIEFVEIIPTPPSCFSPDGEIEITVKNGTPPYRYYIPELSYIDISYDQTYTFSGLYGGVYNITVTDSALCSFTTQVTLTQPNSFAVTSINVINSSCGNNNGSVAISLTGNKSASYVYSLINSIGDTLVQETSLNATFPNLFPDIYSLAITDGICTYSGTVIVSSISLYNITTQVTGTTCGDNNGIVQVFKTTGGTSPFTYSIEGGNGTFISPSTPTALSSFTFNNLSSGSYAVTITDAKKCKEINYFSIDESEEINFILIPTNSTNGSNGEIFANIFQGTPPFILTWSSNVNGQTGTTVSNLSAGTYSLTVQDNDGCAVTKNVILTGVFILSNLSEYNICESTISSTGDITERTLGKMLLEGYLDLTSGCTDCLLSSATFSAVATVAGTAFTQSFYTATTINDVPENSDFYNTVETLLSGVTGIGEVIVDTDNNTITVNTSCEETTDPLSNQNITVQVSILYDINCVSC